jgi:hypothetical protein
MENRKFDLDVYERLFLSHRVLPTEGGSFREVIRIKDLRNALSLNPSEKESCDYVEGQLGPQWNAEKSFSREYDLSEGDMDIIALGFKRMEQEGKIPTNEEFIALYLKFQDIIDTVTL